MDMDSNIVQVCVGVNVLSAYRELQTRRAWHTWAMHHSIVWVILVLPSPPFFVSLTPCIGDSLVSVIIV